jgi:small subunit ribosomal protein S13
MALIAGVNISDNLHVSYALRSIYGIGPKIAVDIVSKAGIEGDPRVRELQDGELTRIRGVIESDYQVEGDLRRTANNNIRRLIDIGSYRGLRHRRGLPLHGQRTRTNARTRRGKSRAIAGRRRTSLKK